MQPPDDSILLRQFAENESNEAFAGLVTRYLNLVYSVALRQTGNAHNAEEISQAVFIILAKKAAELRHDRALSSWLFQTTRLTANNFIRSELRRQRREEEAHMQSILNESDSEVWLKIAPLLDRAVAGLREQDRRAILLRFYEGRNLREVGAALGASEDAAEKRVTRALEKLRRFFTKHGVDSTTAIIAGTISANSVQAAPVALAKTVKAVAVVKGAAASASILTLIQGALKVMAWTKAKNLTVAGICLILILASGTAVIVSKQRRRQAEPKTTLAYARGLDGNPQYRNMLADLRAHQWPAERQLLEAKIKSRQRVNETTHAITIDLRPYINAALTDSPASPAGINGNNLAELPAGTNVYAGVPFDVEGMIQLDGTNLLAFNKHYPATVGNIPIHQRCAKIHLFHGADWIYPSDFGTTVAKLVLHYADGSVRELKIVAGEHVFDCWSPLFTTGVDPRYFTMAPGTERAWTGSNPFIKKIWPDESLVLYKSTFDNPQPDVVIANLDYVSTVTGTTPFLVGLTVE
jgi:RNA polymerase sigma factor (sigma-70 family)